MFPIVGFGGRTMTLPGFVDERGSVFPVRVPIAGGARHSGGNVAPVLQGWATDQRRALSARSGTADSRIEKERA